MLPTHPSLPITVLKRNHAMNWLLEQFPKAFDLRNRRPLKENILEDIISQSDRWQNMPSIEDLQAAYQHYTHWGSYLSAVKEGETCLDLNGDVSATISKQQAQKAKHLLNQALNKLGTSL